LISSKDAKIVKIVSLWKKCKDSGVKESGVRINTIEEKKLAAKETPNQNK
jgi:hypothetical protein